MLNAYNPGRTPQVCDAAGHVIGGGEWREVDPDDETTAALLASGALLEAGE